ncbi:MAG: lactate racemase domain-containing protein [Oscillospiraceae bacterium]
MLALGLHQHTPEEVIRLVGRECYETVRCIDSDAADCIHLGDTAHGTPVDITRAVAEADFRICLGNIEFHYFAGYSGGAKAIMPGVSTRAAIQANHAHGLAAGLRRPSGREPRPRGSGGSRRDLRRGFHRQCRSGRAQADRLCRGRRRDPRASRGLRLSRPDVPLPHPGKGGHRSGQPGRRAEGRQSVPDAKGAGQRKARRQGRRHHHPDRRLPGGPGQQDLF